MSRLCAYRDLLGEPNTGLHAIRIPGIDIALLDVIATFGAAGVISYNMPDVEFWKVSVVLFLLATFLHVLFCVDTPITRIITNIF